MNGLDLVNAANPFDSFFNSSALAFSADVRETAPIASSLMNRALYTRLKIVIHATIPRRERKMTEKKGKKTKGGAVRTCQS
jgi:hypothetical protein